MHITQLWTDNLKITSSSHPKPELSLIRDKHTLVTSVTNPQDSLEYKRESNTHNAEKHNDHNPLQGLPSTYISPRGMFIFKIKKHNTSSHSTNQGI